MRASAVILIAALAGSAVLAQTAKPPAATTKKPAPRPATRKPTAKPLPPVTEPATFACPMTLGQGVRNEVSYCDVQIGRDPAAGIVINFPPHQGPVTLSFDLHNRHTYSEEQI
jgi:hypothetical protein